MYSNGHIKSVLAWSQVLLFCLILANGIFCIHSHKLANGQIVVHAHPYFPQEDGTSLPNNHSTSELIILGQFFHTGIVCSEIHFIDFEVPEIELFNGYHELTYNIVKQYFYYTNHRGPPIYS